MPCLQVLVQLCGDMFLVTKHATPERSHARSDMLIALYLTHVCMLCRCKARLGSYNWAGSQSESGAWVTPAFQLHHSKVDAMSAQKAAPMNIRQPLVGPATTRSTSTSQPTAAQATFDLRSQTDSVQQQMSPENGEANRLKDDSVVPVDAARTVSEAAHSAALIASEIDRPAVVPRNDSKHRNLNASVVR